MKVIGLSLRVYGKDAEGPSTYQVWLVGPGGRMVHGGSVQDLPPALCLELEDMLKEVDHV